MPQRLKLDEDLSPFVAIPFVAAGHDVATVLEQGWSGLKDHELWARVNVEQRMLITADKGFGDIRAYRPGQHAGIVVLRPDRESLLDYRSLAELLVERHRLDDLVGCLTIVTPRGVRIRRREAES